MTDPAIEAIRLTKRFGSITAVDAVSFAIARGSVTALFGGAGAGKTTVISMLLGLVLPNEGVVRILGVDMASNRHYVLSRMNFSSPYVELTGRLTVRENLAAYAHLYGVLGVSRRIAELCRDLDLDGIIDRATASLSAGQKTRVIMAKALINKPDVLLLDEPTASLDPDTADGIRSYLERFRRDTCATILVASHDLTEVERLCDDVLVIREGRIVDRGTPADLIARHGRSALEGRRCGGAGTPD